MVPCNKNDQGTILQNFFVRNLQIFVKATEFVRLGWKSLPETNNLA